MKRKPARKRWTIRKAVREAPENAGRQAYLARHGRPVGLMVHHASLLEDSREALATETREGIRDIYRRGACSAEGALCVHFIEAVRNRDAAKLRELADYLDKPRPTSSDPLRERLAILKLKIQERNAPDGSKFYVRSVSEVADQVGYTGGLRALRRILREMRFPVHFGATSPTSKGTRKRANGS